MASAPKKKASASVRKPKAAASPKGRVSRPDTKPGTKASGLKPEKLSKPSAPPSGTAKGAAVAGGKKQNSAVKVASKPAARAVAPSPSAKKSAKVVSPPVVKKAVSKPSTVERPKPSKPTVEKVPAVKPTPARVIKKIRDMQASKELRKDLAQPIRLPVPSAHTVSDYSPDPKKDRLILIVRDAYWLHASWEVTRRSVERAKAALADHWHSVRPILRLLKVDNSGTTNHFESIVRDIEIHGGVRNWYIDVSDPPSAFRVLLGYVATGDRFHELARSNVVTTPVPGSDEAVSAHWADIAKDAERIFALSGGYNDERETKELQDVFEEHLKRPMGAPALAQFGSGAEGSLRRHRNFHFELDAEMVVFGSTHPDAYVTLGGEPVKVRSDGTFSVRVPLPDRRQVLPATACTRDGVEEQTIVIAVERNTKVMEPLSKENEES
jgi:hypothetical protein